MPRPLPIIRRVRYRMPTYPLAGANNAVEEQRGVGELPEDVMSERLLRDPVLSPRVGYVPGKGSIIVPPNNAGTGAPFSPRYKSSITPFVAAAASQKVLNANSARAYFLVQNNDGASDIFVNFGADASATNAIKVIAGGNLLFDGGGEGGSFVPQEDVYIIGAAGGEACVVMEGLVYHL